ncbi:hypothetical protein GC194_12355 [bacterium]|nr:hypothetical protein [bacterium]
MSYDPFLLRMLFYGIVFLAFALLLSYLKKGIINAGIDREAGANFQLKLTFALFGWIVLLALSSYSGFFTNFNSLPPRQFITLIVPLIAIFLLMRNGYFKQIILANKAELPYYYQAFRIPIELFLWGMFAKDIIPVQMTFEGHNFDIAIAVLGPIVGYLVFAQNKLSKTIAIVYNIFGLLSVITIVAISALSMPTPLQAYHTEPANTLIAYFPYVLLPGFLVPFALLMHAAALYQLFYPKKN